MEEYIDSNWLGLARVEVLRQRGVGRKLVCEPEPQSPFVVRYHRGAIYVRRLEPHEMSAIATSHDLAGFPIAEIDRQWIEGFALADEAANGA